MGGTTSPPLAEFFPTKKSSGFRGTPPPPPKVVFDVLPYVQYNPYAASHVFNPIVSSFFDGIQFHGGFLVTIEAFEPLSIGANWVCNARYDNAKNCAILAMQCLSPACNLDATRQLTWIDADTVTSRLLGGFHKLLCTMCHVPCTMCNIYRNLSLLKLVGCTFAMQDSISST